ncbi:sodium/hydrogen exchanger 6 [Tanacetum coccineum]|uniref:Sodium/hydrogen exchanger 6 n=1 Tax=Tanacetum coccineum TaxID=301880 RepID=A0ABQ5E819_9ASTR
MHAKVFLKADQKFLFCSFIYASNDYKQRRILWQNLDMHKVFIHGSLWALMGDFKASLNLEDCHSSSSKISISMREFKECVSEIELQDVNCSGLHYTWNQKPKGGECILKKIDRVMCNLKFMDEFMGTFSKVVKKEWEKRVDGNKMFQIVSKLNSLKSPFRKLLKDQGNLHLRVEFLRTELDEAEKALDCDPSNSILREEEAIYLKAFNQSILDEERFLKQKAKIKWLVVGDSNSSYFHKSVKSRVQRNRIKVVCNMDNIEHEGLNVLNAFVKHYEMFLGVVSATTPFDIPNLFTKHLPSGVRDQMVCFITNDKIKKVMLSIGDNRALGPDGYSSAFFKKGWDIIGNDVCDAVRDFFTNGRLLKETNHTILALIPKVSTPLRINDYRPISCCNAIYKCISKVITNRIKIGLGLIVSDNQSAFVLGRRISDNILLTQELIHGYHKERGPPRSSVLWEALEEFKEASGLISKGKLPVKYLGVPLISSHLLYKYCKILVENVQNRIDLEKLMRGFLWCQGEMKKGKAKVAWESICFPKDEGGLGIRRLDTFNISLMATHIWSIVMNKESLWVRWIHSYKLMGRSFWDVPMRSCVSWGWRKLLQIRDTIRPCMWYQIGNGTKAFVWFDRWCNECPLNQVKTVCQITNHGFSMKDKVVDVMHNGKWSWQADWLDIQPLLLDPNKDDMLFRRDNNGNLKSFSGLNPSKKCRSALGAYCVVWSYVRKYAAMKHIDSRMANILSWLYPLSSTNSARSNCSRLVVAASAYYIWHERNNRIFRKKARNVEQVRDTIIATVRLKIISLRSKKSLKVAKALEV